MQVGLEKKYKKLFIFDFETSGLNPKTESIIELGAVILELNEESNRFDKKQEIDYFVKINKRLDPKIIELTNITDDMLEKNGIEEYEIFKILDSFIDELTLVIAYNIQFDLSFLLNLYRKYKDIYYQINFDIIDCMAMYKDFYPFPHRLQNAIATFDIDIPNSHRACDDCAATHLVFKHLCNVVRKEYANKMQGKLSYEELKNNTYYTKYINHLGYNPKYPVLEKLSTNIRYTPQFGGKKEIFEAK